MPSITTEDLRAFAEDGYIVVRQIVPHDQIETTRRAVAGEISKAPPHPSSRGPYFYFLTDIPPALLAALDDRVLPLAESLITPARFERPDHVQISLNIPQWPHVPGGPHIDGLTPPEPDGRPATFTLLAGIFLTDQTSLDAGNLWVWPGSHRKVGHRARWRDAVQDPLFEFEPVKAQIER